MTDARSIINALLDAWQPLDGWIGYAYAKPDGTIEVWRPMLATPTFTAIFLAKSSSPMIDAIGWMGWNEELHAWVVLAKIGDELIGAKCRLDKGRPVIAASTGTHLYDAGNDRLVMDGLLAGYGDADLDLVRTDAAGIDAVTLARLRLRTKSHKDADRISEHVLAGGRITLALVSQARILAYP